MIYTITDTTSLMAGDGDRKGIDKMDLQENLIASLSSRGTAMKSCREAAFPRAI